MYINQFQPRRVESGSFRTYISSPNAGYNVTSLNNIICQIRLYRWARGQNYTQQTSIANLRDYLFYDKPEITKTIMGKTILQAVNYDPRKLKAKTKNNPYACMTYCFADPTDLSYGLEWMIVIWLRRVLLNTEDPSVIEEELDFLAKCVDEEIAINFLIPLQDETFYPIDWHELYKKHNINTSQEKGLVKMSRPALIDIMRPNKAS